MAGEGAGAAGAASAAALAAAAARRSAMIFARSSMPVCVFGGEGGGGAGGLRPVWGCVGVGVCVCGGGLRHSPGGVRASGARVERDVEPLATASSVPSWLDARRSAHRRTRRGAGRVRQEGKGKGVRARAPLRGSPSRPRSLR